MRNPRKYLPKIAPLKASCWSRQETADFTNPVNVKRYPATYAKRATDKRYSILDRSTGFTLKRFDSPVMIPIRRKSTTARTMPDVEPTPELTDAIATLTTGSQRLYARPKPSVWLGYCRAARRWGTGREHSAVRRDDTA